MPPNNPSIRNFLYRTSDRINFELAIAEFQLYARLTNMGDIPVKIHSIEENPDRFKT